MFRYLKNNDRHKSNYFIFFLFRMDSQNILSPGPILQADTLCSFDLGLSDQELLDLSAREVTQMCSNFSPEQIKAIKHKRRTLKNREYAGLCRILLYH